MQFCYQGLTPQGQRQVQGQEQEQGLKVRGQGLDD